MCCGKLGERNQKYEECGEEHNLMKIVQKKRRDNMIGHVLRFEELLKTFIESRIEVSNTLISYEGNTHIPNCNGFTGQY